MKKSRLLLLLALVAGFGIIISAVWRTISDEPRYKLDVNFFSVSVTPDWPWLTGLYYMISEDWHSGRFGCSLLSNMNEFDNRRPEVPAGSCSIKFTDETWTAQNPLQPIWIEATITLDLPHKREESSLVLHLSHCPGLKAMAVCPQQSPEVEDDFHTARETPEAIVKKHGLFYQPTPSGRQEIPFPEGKANIYLIYCPDAADGHWIALRIGITRQ